MAHQVFFLARNCLGEGSFVEYPLKRAFFLGIFPFAPGSLLTVSEDGPSHSIEILLIALLLRLTLFVDGLVWRFP